MDKFSFLNTVHTEQISDMYEQYLKDPDVVEPSWRSFFQGYDLANSDFKKQEILSNKI
jgi:2-oxoglutarate dehydrogenase E1 component